MDVLPAYLEPFLGEYPILREICPGTENRGPLVAKIRDLTAGELLNNQPSGGAAAVERVRGGLFYAVDALSPAHQIFQDDESDLGSYWHGMMHRREGDFGNACYWFRRAGRIEPLGKMPGFDPVKFTERCSQQREPTPDLLALQSQEWTVLISHCLSLAVR